MKVKNKIILVVALAAVGYSAIHLMIHFWQVIPSLREIEMNEVRKDMKRAVKAVDRDLDHLDLLCHDWAQWDDSYEFVADENQAYRQEYIESNLIEATFVNNRLALIFYVNVSGQVVWGRCFSGELAEFVSLKNFPEDQWPPDHPMLKHRHGKSSLKGFLASAEGPIMISSRPIIRSDGSGEISGSLIMGRLLCERCVELLRDRTQLDLDVWAMDCELMPAEACLAKESLSPTRKMLFNTDQDWIYGYTYFSDIYNQPVMLLRTRAWRSIYKKTSEGVLVDMAMSVGGALLVSILLIYILNLNLARPLATFSQKIAKMSKIDEFKPLEFKDRNDEISLLYSEFNQMISRLREDGMKRARAESELRSSQAKLSAVLGAAPDAIIIINRKGKIILVNPAATQMFGYKESDMLGRNIFFLTDPDQHSLLREEAERLQACPHDSVFSVGVEISGRCRDGSFLLLHCKLGFVKLEDAVHYVCLVRDVSGLKEIHAKLMRAQHLASIGEMGASIAHEVRNPLAAISGAVQVMLDTADKEDATYPVLIEIEELTEKIEATVSRLLEYAKDWHPKLKHCVVIDLISKTVEDYRRRPDLETIEIRVGGDSDVKALVDSDLISQVLVNLMDNAVDACRGKNGVLLWDVKKGLKEIYISLEDNGSGVGEEVMENVFKPFFTTREKGHGLGLAICQKIIERHNGRISLENQLHGTRVSIVLPKSKFLKSGNRQS